MAESDGTKVAGYERYWKSYAYMKSWISKHRETMGVIQRNLWCPNCASRQTDNNHSFEAPVRLSTNQSYPTVKQIDYGSHVCKSRNTKRRRRSSGSYFASDGEEFQADFPDDFIKFMEISAQHKKEREAQKEAERRNEKKFDTKGLFVDDKERSSAPTEQPGKRRTHEIKLLYGEKAQKIHGIETAQQLTFQQACDKLKPRLWPNIPLKIVFD